MIQKMACLAWQCQNSHHLHLGLIDLHLHFLVNFGIHSPYPRCRLIVRKKIGIQSPLNLQATHIQENKDTWVRRAIWVVYGEWFRFN
jgi:hypothetical protein